MTYYTVIVKVNAFNKILETIKRWEMETEREAAREFSEKLRSEEESTDKLGQRDFIHL